ncbi:MAG: class I SAM-dependent methyltransferase, partial [Vicinamibacterales bacterium]
MCALKYDAGASEYDRLTGRWSRKFVPTVLRGVAASEGSRILDIATGTGDAAIAAAAIVGRSGRVVGLDTSAPMLEIAREKASAAHIEFTVGDARELSFPADSFDGVTCLFGLMFIPDLRTALEGFRRVLRGGGSMAATTWCTAREAPFAGFVAEELAVELPSEREDLLRPFSLSNRDTLARILAEAGFGEVSVVSESHEMTFESVADFWQPIEAGGGRLGQAYLSLSHVQRTAVKSRVLAQLPFAGTGGTFS